MSMLAERKRKQKWSLNPRGKEWSQDTNKFGQKMLEKMGWQHGKGLGAKESGITEHIKISYKNDSKGMGYKESNDQWTEHETKYSALLESLTGDSAKLEAVKVDSLEKKSQSSRARVHYHKFTRGKDLSRYSEKDLANIFGKKSLKEVKTEKPVEVENDSKDNKSGFLFNGGSMRDYFKKKLPGLGKSNRYTVGNNGVLKKADETESEGECRPSFGFGFKSEKTSEEVDKPTFVSYIKEEAPTKRKAQETIEDMVFSPKKKSKKDKKPRDKEENLGLSNPSFNPLATPVQIQKHVLEPIEENLSEETVEEASVENVKEKKKRKNVIEQSENTSSYESPKKKKKTEVEGSVNPILHEGSANCEGVENSYEVKVKKTKKKKGLKNGVESVQVKPGAEGSEKENHLVFDNPNFNEADDSLNQKETEENTYELKLKKKKKKNKKTLDETPDLENTEENSSAYQIENGSAENPGKKKKKKKTLDLEHSDLNDLQESLSDISKHVEKKKKTKNGNLAIDNPCFNVSEESFTDLSHIEENPHEIKKRKKKKLALDNPSFDDAPETQAESSENPYEIKVKKKKKKKSKNDTVDAEPISNVDSEKGIANPALCINDSIDKSIVMEDLDLILNIVSTPETKKDISTALDSEPRTGGVSRRKSVRFSDITQERIIPSKEEMKELYRNDPADEKIKKKRKYGVDNLNFDKQKASLDENLDSIAKTLDTFQAEIDNDINEEKVKAITMEDVMVGEVGSPDGENEELPGGTRLKFKYANLNSKTPLYHLNSTGPKKSYKHLIKGDIMVMFDGTNLHEVEGYAVKEKREEGGM
nr:uncharacterized protein LOC111504455 [Leptinotarsa decemlineata]